MERFRSFQGARALFGAAVAAIAITVLGGVIFQFYICRIEAPTGHMVILTRKTGLDLPVNEEIAPTGEYKGVQRDVLGEGRYYRNPWSWSWVVVPQIEIPEGQLGVRTRLYGDDPPYGEVIAASEKEKGIVPEVLRPGRYPYNAWVVGTDKRPADNYAEYIELFDPIRIPAGFKGVVTNLAGPLPEEGQLDFE
jgi:hypothetical protein